MTNREIAKIFNQLANMLEIKGENPFKVRAYRNAARVIDSLPKNLETMVQNGEDLTKLPAIGEQIAAKIKEIVQTGKLQKLERLKRLFPPALLSFLSIEGLGANRVKTLYEKLHINTINELQKMAKEHKIRTLKGFGPKLEEKISKGLKFLKQEGVRFLYAEAEPFANELQEYLQNAPSIIKVEIAGSFRRRKETVGDLDILASAKEPEIVIDYFTKFPKIAEVISAGDTRSTVVLQNSLQVDLRVVKNEHFGSALHYFTGSKAHVLAIRKMAIEMGLKVNEYGIFKNGENLASKSEEEFYKVFNLDYIEPELRENRGEILAAKENKLPNLITLNDLKSDLHMHTTFSDGIDSLETMAEAAKDLGYEYIAITDHCNNLSIVKGLSRDKIPKYFNKIDELNTKYENFKILKGIEVDILEDGSLSYEDEVLKQFDIVLGSIHTKFNLTKEQQTKRLVKAAQNRYLNAISHISCRLIGKRAPIALDYQEVFKAIKEENKLLEIDSHPSRLDINDIFAKEAKEMGIKFLINTDAHSRLQLNNLKYGINQARRGWLEKDDVVNAKSLNEFLKIIKS